jgi:transposase
MEVLYPRCAGLDVHKDAVVACVRLAGAGKAELEVQSFATSTPDLLALQDWLTDHGCTHVAMEATGVYWKPVWHILEGSFELVLANAAQVRNVPGRKTDVNDATWIAELLAHGLIRSSFVPPAPIQDFRDLTRSRKQLVRQVSRHTLRIQKTLEDANIKLSSVIADTLGPSGRAMIEAMIEGVTDPEKILERSTGRLKAPRGKLLDALTGLVTDHHRFMLRLHLDQIDALQKAIRRLEERMGALLEPFRRRAQLLMTTPGVNHIVAQTIVAEVGIDMSRFPTHHHLISWAGLCSRMHESAGKRRSTRLRKGAPWLKTVLVQAAWSAIRVQNSYLRSQFLRLKSRRGPKKAIVAVAASILTAAYYILRDEVPYRDLGASHFDTLDKSRTVRRLTQRLESLGYRVELRAA